MKINNYITFFGLSLIILLSSLFFQIAPLMLLGALMTFTLFDILGYYFLMTRKRTADVEKNSDENKAYRSIQICFQILLTLVVALFSVPAAFSFIMLWWIGLADLFYYFFLKVHFREYRAMTWMNWTIAGILFPNISGVKFYVITLFLSSVIITEFIYFTYMSPFTWNLLNLIGV